MNRLPSDWEGILWTDRRLTAGASFVWEGVLQYFDRVGYVHRKSLHAAPLSSMPAVLGIRKACDSNLASAL